MIPVPYEYIHDIIRAKTHKIKKIMYKFQDMMWNNINLNEIEIYKIFCYFSCLGLLLFDNVTTVSCFFSTFYYAIIESLFLASFFLYFFLFITIIIRNTISARIDAFIIYYWILLNRVKWDLHTCTWANENNIIWNGCCAEWIDEKKAKKNFN